MGRSGPDGDLEASAVGPDGDEGVLALGTGDSLEGVRGEASGAPMT